MPDVPLSPLAEALRHHYLLERGLGREGTSTVYLARDLKHDRSVALRLLWPELFASLGLECFLREIQLLADPQLHCNATLRCDDAPASRWFTP